MGILFLLAGSIAITLYINIYRFKNWRCPNCRTFLGNSIYIDRCQNCNSSFNGEKSVNKEPLIVKDKLKQEPDIIKPKIQIPKELREYENSDIYN